MSRAQRDNVGATRRLPEGRTKVININHLYLAIILTCFGIVGQMDYNDQAELAKAKQQSDQQLAQSQQPHEAINYLGDN